MTGGTVSPDIWVPRECGIPAASKAGSANMETSMKRILAMMIAGLVAGLAASVAVPANAQEVSGGVVAECPLTGPGVAVCGTAAVVLHELVEMANGKQGFGPNGEIMKIIAAPVKIVDGNVKAAARESGEVAKVVRGVTGISIRDIEKYGLAGGPNSVLRKPFGP